MGGKGQGARGGRGGLAMLLMLLLLRPAFNTQFNTKFMGSVSDDMRLTRQRNENGILFRPCT